LGSLAIRLLEQELQVFADKEISAGAGGLIRTEVIELIQQAGRIPGQGIHPGGKALVIEQHLQEVLHIHIGVPPAPRLVLGRQQQIPGRIAEAIRGAGEGVRPHGSES